MASSRNIWRNPLAAGFFRKQHAQEKWTSRIRASVLIRCSTLQASNHRVVLIHTKAVSEESLHD